ncbi:MAG TPA: DUF2339 domain-containing protein [Thermoanaerobaculia bacterium]|nr:DUF2339 domain-containing protein [Thermoanaerobaculia bacterium]
MECVGWLVLGLIVAVFVVAGWMASRRTRFEALEEAIKAQERRNTELALRLDRLTHELELMRQGEKEPLTPGPSPIALPTPGRGEPPPVPAPPQPPAPEPALPPSPIPPPPKPAFDWENLVGVRLFSWMAAIMLAIAAIFFLRYSLEQGWLGPAVRMAIGILTGAGLLVACELKAARRYPVTANALDAAGIAILFSTIFASHALWGLLSVTPAFLLMALVAAVAVALAIRRGSPFIALLGLVGGFATPALLSTGQDRPIALFGYLLLLNAGLSWVALSRRWAVLIRLALAFTVVYQWIWVLRYLDPERIALAMGIFLVFPALHLLAPVLVGKKDTEIRHTVALSAVLPFVFAIYLGAVSRLGEHTGLLFGFLAILVLASAVFALVHRTGWLQVVSLALSHVVVFAWMLRMERVPWMSVTIGIEAALAAFGVAAIFAARWREGEDGPLTRAFALGGVAGLFLAQLVVGSTGLSDVPPGLALALPVQSGLLIALLALAWKLNWPGLAPASVLTSFLAVAAFWNQDGPFWDHLALATVILLIYLAYPLALGPRARQLRQPWLAAVLATVAYFFLARLNLEELGFGNAIGLLPVLLAGALAFLLKKLLDLEPRGERDPGRLALVAGAALAFVTVAIPLQLEKQWITIGWALLAAALAWLHRRIPHRGLLLWTAGLSAAVFARLSLNPAVLTYHPRAEVPIWNWYLYTYLVAAAALLGAAWLLRRTEDRLSAGMPRLSSLLSAAGGVLLFLLLNIEIADFFSKGPTLTFGFGRATLAEGLTYTLGWGIFALALLVTGIAARSRGTRIAAIALLLATVLKGFLLDLAALGGLYRVASFVGLAVCLAAVAVLIQKFVLARTAEGE